MKPVPSRKLSSEITIETIIPKTSILNETHQNGCVKSSKVNPSFIIPKSGSGNEISKMVLNSEQDLDFIEVKNVNKHIPSEAVTDLDHTIVQLKGNFMHINIFY